MPIPVPDQLPRALEVETLDEEHMEGVEPVRRGPGGGMAEDEEPVDPVDLEAIQELMRPHGLLQNLTMIEILEDRSVTSLLAGLSRLHA